MAKIIISENQFNLLTKKLMSEDVGVPDYILDSDGKCIMEWELYHEIMEKKYGRRKIDTEYKYKKNEKI